MAKKNSKPTETITVKTPATGAPANLLAHVEILFASGLLAGLRLTGIALWAAKAGDGRRFVSVTFPARQVEGDEGTRYFDHLRGSGEDIKRLKAAIVEAFRAHAQAEALEVPEDAAGEEAVA